MDEKISELAVKVESIDQRAKSNTHAITDLKADMKEMRDKQDAIYELTISVKSIAQDMAYIKRDVEVVKEGQDEMKEDINTKIDGIDKKVDSKIKDIEDKVETVDSKTKIDFATAIKDNFWKIIITLLGCTGVVKLIVDMMN